MLKSDTHGLENFFSFSVIQKKLEVSLFSQKYYAMQKKENVEVFLKKKCLKSNDVNSIFQESYKII